MGEPGAGAEEQASRRARRAAELRAEEARGTAIDEALLRHAEADVRSWSKGAEGERQVADVLRRLQRYGWTALHDVRWPGRPRANIDHIAIGPGGVVVIDAKNWSGDVGVRDGVLRQSGYRRSDQIDGVAQAAAAVTTLLAPQYRTSTRAVLCLTSQDHDPESVPGVDVVGRWQLPELLLALPPRLTAYETADLARQLAKALDGSRPVPTAVAQVPRQRRPASPPRPRGTARSGRARGRATRRRGNPLGGLLRVVVAMAALWLAYLFLTGTLGGLATHAG